MDQFCCRCDNRTNDDNKNNNASCNADEDVKTIVCSEIKMTVSEWIQKHCVNHNKEDPPNHWVQMHETSNSSINSNDSSGHATIISNKVATIGTEKGLTPPGPPPPLEGEPSRLPAGLLQIRLSAKTIKPPPPPSTKTMTLATNTNSKYHGEIIIPFMKPLLLNMVKNHNDKKKEKKDRDSNNDDNKNPRPNISDSNNNQFFNDILRLLTINPPPPPPPKPPPFSSTSAVGKERKSRMKSIPVILNIYDFCSNIVGMNTCAKWFGMGGIFHAGIEIYGQEYSFGCKGIFHLQTPKQCLFHKYRESIVLGEFKIKEGEEAVLPHQVRQILKSMTKSSPPSSSSPARSRYNNTLWTAQTYDALYHNCCNFCHEFAIELGVGGIPPWINSFVQDILQPVLGDGRDTTNNINRRSAPVPPAPAPKSKEKEKEEEISDEDGDEHEELKTPYSLSSSSLK